MKPTQQVLDTIANDLFSTATTRVIYLEGISDPRFLFGLLGIPIPAGNTYIHQQTLVKGLSATDRSGNSAVKQLVEIGTSHFSGKVFGIIDGDGQSLSTLASQFDAPYSGPLFAWKAYSIECLFAQLPWPSLPLWGTAPDWKVELAAYAPYVAINRLHRLLNERLDALRLDKFWKPETGKPLETVADVTAALTRDHHLLNGLDLASEFNRAVSEFQNALTNSPEEGLVMLNGKWLFRHFLIERLTKNSDYWTEEWIKHAVASGGLPSVRDLWQRITGKAP